MSWFPSTSSKKTKFAGTFLLSAIFCLLFFFLHFAMLCLFPICYSCYFYFHLQLYRNSTHSFTYITYVSHITKFAYISRDIAKNETKNNQNHPKWKHATTRFKSNNISPYFQSFIIVSIEFYNFLFFITMDFCANKKCMLKYMNVFYLCMIRPFDWIAVASLNYVKYLRRRISMDWMEHNANVI